MDKKEREVPIRIVYKKRRSHGGHHGGAWKVAFADFMTAMFALFLVLWLVNQSSDVKSAIAGYFQDPLGRADEFGSSIMPGEGAQAMTPRTPLTQFQVMDLRRAQLQSMARDLEERLDDIPELSSVQEQVEIKLTGEGLQIQLLEDSVGVFFQSGNATPSPRGVAILAMIGSELGRLPNAVQIDGYTDARPFRSAIGYSNWELSADRANAARRILTGAGLPARQVKQIRGHADRRLRDPAHPFAAANRRITITMLLSGADPPEEAASADPA